MRKKRIQTTTNQCLVCMSKAKSFIDVYSLKSDRLKVREILSKHLWFQCNPDKNCKLCTECWDVLKKFHEFYVKISIMHGMLNIFTNNFKTEDVIVLKPEIDVLSTSSNNVIKVVPLEVQQENDEPIEIKIDIGPECISDDMDTNIEEIDGFNQKKGFLNVNVLEKHEEITPEFHLIDIDNPDKDSDYNYDVSQENDQQDSSNNSHMDSDFISNETILISNDLKISKTNGKRKLNNFNCDEINGDLELERVKKKKNINANKLREEDESIGSIIQMACELCGEEFSGFRGCKDHYRKIHKANGYLSCCETKFYRRNQLVGHIQKHLNPNGYTCTVCNKKFANKRGLKFHMEKHDNNLERPFQCDKCPKRFVRQHLLKHHQIRHATEKPHVCSECDKAFVLKSFLDNHVRVVHRRAYIHVCDICAKEFKSKCSYEQHYQITHSEEKLPTVQCQVCGQWLKHEISLRSHMIMHLQAGNTYICNICGKKSPNSHALRCHQKYAHFDQKIHKCTICEKAFKREQSLKEHMTTHTGDILYSCSFCPKTFNSSSNMHAHRKKIHPVEWAEGKKKYCK